MEPSAPKIDFRIDVAYDDDARVWIVEDSGIRGLTIEATSLEALAAKIETTAPILLTVNRQVLGPREVFLGLFSKDPDNPIKVERIWITGTP